MLDTLKRIYWKYFRIAPVHSFLKYFFDGFINLVARFQKFYFPAQYIRQWKVDMLFGTYEKETTDLYKKIILISENVKEDLRKKGLVIPVENSDGSISVGRYRIVKCPVGYAIVDRDDEIIVKNINLPQTAAILANGIALGKGKDTELLYADQCYGYADFDEQLQKKALNQKNKNDIFWFDIRYSKLMLAKAKKENNRNFIFASFEKLRKSYK